MPSCAITRQEGIFIFIFYVWQLFAESDSIYIQRVCINMQLLAFKKFEKLGFGRAYSVVKIQILSFKLTKRVYAICLPGVEV